MSTTSLFVELIVVGVGAAIWLALLTLALFGYEWVQVPADKALSIPAAIATLSPRTAEAIRSRLHGVAKS